MFLLLSSRTLPTVLSTPCTKSSIKNLLIKEKDKHFKKGKGIHKCSLEYGDNSIQVLGQLTVFHIRTTKYHQKLQTK